MKTFLLLLAVAVWVIQPAPAGAAAPGTNAVVPPCCAKPEASAGFTDKSIYQTESQWTDDLGKSVKLGALAGRAQVVVMFFASCQMACPLLVNDAKRIEAALPKELAGKVGFTLVSFDVKRDTPKALAGYRRTRGLGKSWTLLCGQPEDIQELAALLGVRYKEEADGTFRHSNLITLLNAKGEIVHQQAGLNQEVEPLVKILQKLAAR